MLTNTADAIAIVGVCGVLISAIIKYSPRRCSSEYVKKDACKARIEMLTAELKNMHAELRDLNKYVRGLKS